MCYKKCVILESELTLSLCLMIRIWELLTLYAI